MVSIRRFFRFVASSVTGRGSSHHGIVGQTLRGRYKILRKLGRGGLGQTYLAEDLQMMIVPRPQRVIKQILPEQMNAGAQRYFRKEAHALSSLKHSQIPVLYDFFEVEGIPYIVQDFIEGHDLTAEIGHYGNADAAKLWTDHDVRICLIDMLEILTYIHTQNIIHRDVKPSNIMRRKNDGKLILIDFGIAKNVRDDSSLSRNLIGTRGYMPPEQLQCKPRFNSDIYALGMTAIQLITGLSPLAQGRLRLQHRKQPISPALVEVISRMIEKDHSRRYQSAAEVLSSLRSLQRASQSRKSWLESSMLRTKKQLERMRTLATSMPLLFLEYMRRRIGIPGKSWIVLGVAIIAIYLLTIFLPLLLSGLHYKMGNIKYDNNYSQGALSDYNEAINFRADYSEAYEKRGDLK
jgi:serine/threonine protein kinase